MKIIILTSILVYLLVYLIELVGLHAFKLNFFSAGITVQTRKVKVVNSKWANKDGIYKANQGRYVFIPNLKAGYFVTRFKFFRRFGLIGYSIGNPCTIFGNFQEISNEVVVKYRISYRTMSSIFIWYLLLIIFTFYNGELKFIGIGAVFIIITTIIFSIYYQFQKRRMSIICDEIIMFLKE